MEISYSQTHLLRAHVVGRTANTWNSSAHVVDLKEENLCHLAVDHPIELESGVGNKSHNPGISGIVAEIWVSF